MNEHDEQTIQTDHETTTEPEVNRDETSPEESPRLVPVSEAKKYRKRAQAAEKLLDEMKAQLTEKEALLTRQMQDLADLNRSREIDERLLEAETIDLEAARLLTELALKEMDEPDLDRVVTELCRRKPYLFHRRVRSTSTHSPHQVNGESHHAAALGKAAQEAGSTGRRSDLLRYLRLRRGGS